MGIFPVNTRCFKYDRDCKRLVYTQIVPVIFEPPCITSLVFSRIPHKSTYVCSGCTNINLHCYILQVFGTVPTICFFYGLPSFYGTVLCIACSQLELLRTRLLEINEKTETLEGESGFETGEKEGNGQTCITQAVFSHMQKQLNDCVSHHQLIVE